MAEAPHDDPVFVSERLDDRVLTTLEARNGRVPFSGLRRALGAHPESLSRALRRLEREGLVDRSIEGYRSVRPPPPRDGPPLELHSVATVEVPTGLDTRAVLDRLRGRWFGSLRWMGVVDGADGRMLSWARRDGTGSVLLGSRGNAVEVFASSETELTDPAESEEAAYELLVAVAEALRPHAIRSSVTFLAAPESPPSARRAFGDAPRTPSPNN
jgi:DNA-binding transcriptional ArsR family regulator